MSIQAHLNTLHQKHFQLKKTIKSCATDLQSDSTKLTDLKKQKLLLKEKIYQLQSPDKV